jgi:hypothetical protein
MPQFAGLSTLLRHWDRPECLNPSPLGGLRVPAPPPRSGHDARCELRDDNSKVLERTRRASRLNLGRVTTRGKLWQPFKLERLGEVLGAHDTGAQRPSGVGAARAPPGYRVGPVLFTGWLGSRSALIYSPARGDPAASRSTASFISFTETEALKARTSPFNKDSRRAEGIHRLHHAMWRGAIH